MKFLLDTNVVSEPLRSEPVPSIVRKLQNCQHEIAIPAPVWHELQFGCSRLPPSERRTKIERYLQEVVLPSFPVFDYDWRSADWHARERARLSAVGKEPPFVDGQIAAIACVNSLTLVTMNVRHFRHFEELRTENWA